MPAKIPIIARFVTLLPDPDSPTIANVSPLYKSNDTSLTALTKPLGVLNEIVKFLLQYFLFHLNSLNCGLSASLNALPNILNEIINIETTTVGAIINYRFPAKICCWPSFRITPIDVPVNSIGPKVKV